eukprot:5276026-Pyramimonas_sp.AAC.1
MIRQLSGSQGGRFLIYGGYSAVTAAEAADTTYAEKAQEKNCKDLGTPHLHIGVDFHLETGLNDRSDETNKTILKEDCSLTHVTGMQGFGDIATYIKVKKAYSEGGQP